MNVGHTRLLELDEPFEHTSCHEKRFSRDIGIAIPGSRLTGMFRLSCNHKVVSFVVVVVVSFNTPPHARDGEK